MEWIPIKKKKKNLYTDNEAQVLSPDDEAVFSQILAIEHQGNTLSPFCLLLP